MWIKYRITFYRKELEDLDVKEVAREKLVLQDVKQTDSMRMDVSSPKLAIGIRGNREVAEAECYRHHILLKLLFAMMFGWTSDRFQKLYESGKIDASLSLEIEVTSRFSFCYVDNGYEGASCFISSI